MPDFKYLSQVVLEKSLMEKVNRQVYKQYTPIYLACWGYNDAAVANVAAVAVFNNVVVAVINVEVVNVAAVAVVIVAAGASIYVVAVVNVTAVAVVNVAAVAIVNVAAVAVIKMLNWPTIYLSCFIKSFKFLPLAPTSGVDSGVRRQRIKVN